MRKYEFTIIFNPDEDATEQGLTRVLAELEAAKVEITKQDDMGVKTLAYPIHKHETGHYFYFELNADPATINTFNNSFRLMHPVLKFLFVLKSK
ncbi:MAG: 30S ribosomal protein S6 [Sphaerochaetaceae bacterium]|jgi:small subunit ribosomal protein S6|nr:30S ribosomal protein S6 [Spirochaetales bacterium]